MEEILHLLGCLFKTLVNNEINYQPQLVKAGFPNHQQYVRGRYRLTSHSSLDVFRCPTSGFCS